MIRKFAAALVALVIAVGSMFADEIKGTFVKFADGTLTLKVDDKDKEYKIPADLKVKYKTKDGEEKEVLASARLEKAKEGRSHPDGRRRQGDGREDGPRQAQVMLRTFDNEPAASGGLVSFPNGICGCGETSDRRAF